MSNTLLDQARQKVYGDREKEYGPPTHNIETIAEFWRIYLEKKHNVLLSLLPEDVCQMMVLLKLARQMNDPTHHDSLVDIAGWAAVQDRIQTFDGQMELPFGGTE